MADRGNNTDAIFKDFLEHLLRFEDAGWKVAGSGDYSLSVPIPSTPISFGGGVGYLDVEVTRGFARRDDKYRCKYSGFSLGAGVLSPKWLSKAPSPATSEGLSSFSIGQIRRLPGSTDATGENGAPRGFLGALTIIGFSAGIIYGKSIALVLLGAAQSTAFTIGDPSSYERFVRQIKRLKEGKSPDSPFYKYATVIGGDQAGLSIGAGVSQFSGNVNSVSLNGKRVA
jgi:hypothetical protein